MKLVNRYLAGKKDSGKPVIESVYFVGSNCCSYQGVVNGISVNTSLPDAGGDGTIDILNGEPAEVVGLNISLFAGTPAGQGTASNIYFAAPIDESLDPDINTGPISVVLLLDNQGELSIPYNSNGITQTIIIEMVSRSSGNPLPTSSVLIEIP